MRRFLRDRSAATAAEFALLLPLVVLFLLGIIDAGRYAWEFNKAEKATQAGARYAVVTNMIPTGLANYSFAVSGGINQGTVVPIDKFGGMTCSDNNGTVACTCLVQTACAFGTASSDAAFLAVVQRMQLVKRDITRANVVVEYRWSGLGYSGDPNGPDVAPLVNVRLKDMTLKAFALFGRNVSLPSASYSLTMEDGKGTESDG